MQDIFETQQLEDLKKRILAVDPTTQPKWGKMSADQMMAHLNVQFDMLYTNQYKKPNAVMRFFLNLMVKPYAAGTKAYPKNSRTAPQFVVSDARDFKAEQNKLLAYLDKTNQLGVQYLVGTEYPSFGKLTEQEWRILLAKHIDYHLSQFGV